MISTWNTNEHERRVRDISAAMNDMDIKQHLCVLCAINPSLIDRAERARQLLSNPNRRASDKDAPLIEEMERAFTRLRAARMNSNTQKP